jgi:hypothetical protein
MYQALVAFECSGRTRNALRRLGIDAWSVDKEPSDDNSPFHIIGDARVEMAKGGRLLIAHPPCDRLTNAGVRWLEERNLWDDLDAGVSLFLSALEAPFDHIAVENPIPHGYAVERIGRKYDFIVQPWMFGDGFTKATCFWTKKLPRLIPTNIVAGREPAVWKKGPGPDRKKFRSMTYQGIADALAAQYGPFSRPTS